MKPTSAPPAMRLKPPAAKPAAANALKPKPKLIKAKTAPSQPAQPASAKPGSTNPVKRRKTTKPRAKSVEMIKKPKAKLAVKKSVNKAKPNSATAKLVTTMSKPKKPPVRKQQPGRKIAKTLDIALEIEKKIAKGGFSLLNKDNRKIKDTWPPSIFRTARDTEKFMEAVES